MSTKRSTMNLGSDSDASDPTFVPRPSSTTQNRITAQAQRRSSRNSQDRSRSNTGIRSSPPVQASSSGTRQQSSQLPIQTREFDWPVSETSSSEQELESYHLGPFTYPPYPPYPLPTPRLSRAQITARSASTSTSRSPRRPSRARSRTSRSPSESDQTQPIIKLRSNTFLGPTSTWRSWTQDLRSICDAIEQRQAQDLSRHLFCAYALRRNAELAEVRARSRGDGSSEGQDEGQSEGAKGKGRKRVKGKEKAIDKGKGKARADTTSPPGSPESVIVIEDTEVQESEAPESDEPVTWRPPAIWTAWPLPPHELPREEFLPHALLKGLRMRKQPSIAEVLEDCLLAATSRFAKERWQARERESSEADNLEATEVEGSRKRQKVSRPAGPSRATSEVEDDLVPKQEEDADDEDADREDRGRRTSRSRESTPRATSSGNGIKMFSSQLFSRPSPSPSPSPSSFAASHRKRVFLADDDRLRELLLPKTQQTILQFEDLLRTLQDGNEEKPPSARVEKGKRGWREIVAEASEVFGKDVAERTEARCVGLFERGFELDPEGS